MTVPQISRFLQPCPCRFMAALPAQGPGHLLQGQAEAEECDLHLTAEALVLGVISLCQLYLSAARGDNHLHPRNGSFIAKQQHTVCGCIYRTHRVVNVSNTSFEICWVSAIPSPHSHL